MEEWQFSECLVTDKMKACNFCGCKVDDKVTGAIQNGFMLLVGFKNNDTKENVLDMVKKVINLGSII